jgi:uncharacterized protein (TIGR00255 family)
MTAYARQEAGGTHGVLVWELRSLNHRYLDVSVRVPEELRMLEPVIRERVAGRLGRGKVECGLRYLPSTVVPTEILVNTDFLQRLLGTCQAVEQHLDKAAPVSAIELLRWPGVVREEDRDTGPLQEHALALLDRALDELADCRGREGRKIVALLLQRCDSMAVLVKEARSRVPKVRERLREKLVGRLAELNVPADPGRLEQELVFLAQKMDVDEELDRLEGHIAEVRRILHKTGPAGRRLDFLMQEFNREANTLASKSADADTTRTAVELKVLIEQMREQVQNVE